MITEDSRDSAVKALLLQQQLELLNRRSAATRTHRLLFVAASAIPIVTPSLPLVHLGALGFVCLMLSLLWYSERRSTGFQLRAIEETLTRSIGGEWEDVYIKTRHFTAEIGSFGAWTRMEPMLWLYPVAVACAANYLAARLG